MDFGRCSMRGAAIGGSIADDEGPMIGHLYARRQLAQVSPSLLVFRSTERLVTQFGH